MDLSIIRSRALSGLDAPPVRVETHLSNGLPAFHIVGLPETAVRESKDRVRSAIINSCFPHTSSSVNWPWMARCGRCPAPWLRHALSVAADGAWSSRRQMRHPRPGWPAAR